MKTKQKCRTCMGYGLWAWDSIADRYNTIHRPMGEMDAGDGYPTIECPECHSNHNPLKKMKQKHIEEGLEL